MNIAGMGRAHPEAGRCLPRKPLRPIVADCLLGALRSSFALGRGGTKALSAASERDRKTAYCHLNGKANMVATDLLMVCVRHPRFFADLACEMARAGLIDDVALHIGRWPTSRDPAFGAPSHQREAA